MAEQVDSPERMDRWIERLKPAWARSAIGALEIELVDMNDEQIEMHMPITDAVRQPAGLLHGGASMLLAESAASTHANWLLRDAGSVALGVEISGSHLRPARDGTVRAVGKVLRSSRTLIVHQVEMQHVETGRLLSVARVTNYVRSEPASTS